MNSIEYIRFLNDCADQFDLRLNRFTALCSNFRAISSKSVWAPLISIGSQNKYIGFKLCMPGADIKNRRILKKIGISDFETMIHTDDQISLRIYWDCTTDRLIRSKFHFSIGAQDRRFLLSKPGEALIVCIEKYSPLSITPFASLQLKERFRVFNLRCPILRVESEWENNQFNDSWRIVLSKPEPWARLLRLDASEEFAQDPPGMSLVCAGLDVAALEWSAQTPWVELSLSTGI